jgi:hypothetical protein
LPGLDVLFRQESPASQRVDLLVFLTIHLENATEISDRDRKVYDMYKPHFKQIERLQDVPVHFEIPTEYEAPKPMFGDPRAEADVDEQTGAKQAVATEKRAAKPAAQPKSARSDQSEPVQPDQVEWVETEGQGFVPRFKESASPAAATKQSPAPEPAKKNVTAARSEDAP